MHIGNRYKIEKQIGVGGMGTVFKGTDTQTGATVAIKHLKPDILRADPHQLDRFIREGELLRQLNHPNIVKMLDAIDHGDDHYLIMEYVAGGSLHDVLQKTPQLSIQRVLYTALDVADALTRAHRLNVLHRDIKPANVLLDADGTPRLTDFGMARSGNVNITEEGTIVGTLAYLSPEALTGGDVDERSDIWAFGIMLFEMLAGERPFMQVSAGQLIHAILTAPIPDLETIRNDVPVALVDLINRMLKRDVQARIPSVRLIGAELEAIIRGGTTSVQYVPNMEDTDRFDSDNFTPIEPITSRITPPNNLPNQPTAFVGREDEIEAIEKLVNQDANRLITLAGVGGIGKTRLALAVAERFVRPTHTTSMHNLVFSDGVYFVPLASVDHEEALIKTIADHTLMTFAGTDPARVQLLHYLSEKKMLIVLDNFEHLTAHADLLADMLKSAPNIKLLVTSRELLRLRGEQLYEVPPLHIPNPRQSVDEIASYCATKLFVQSAKRVMPDFELDEQTAPYVAKICNFVGGLPLGIELSASWLEMLPIEEISAEIEKSLDFLETDLRDVPERQRSLRAVFEYSWNLLKDDEREAFTKLSIFKGGFEREAAHKIAGASLRALTSLVNKSLIQRYPNGRYGLNKVLRQYAEEILNNRGDAQAVKEAHALYYGELLVKLTPLFNTLKEKTAIELMDSEWENIREALNNAMDMGACDEIDKISYPLLMYYINRSLFREGADVFDRLAGMIKNHQGENEMFWRTRVFQAWLLSRIGNYAEAWDYSAPAEAYFKQHNITIEMSETLNMLSYIKMMQGDYAASVAYAKEALSYAPQSRQEQMAWYMSNGNWGYAEFLRGNQQQALQIYEEIVSRMRQLQDYSPNGMGYMLNNLGEILRGLGRMDEALALFQEAYAIFEANNIKRGMAFTLNNIGGIQIAKEDVAVAQSYYQRAYDLHKEIGDLNGLAHSISALGNNEMFLGHAKEAKMYFDKSLSIRKKIGERRGIADSLNDLGRVYALMGDFSASLKHFREAEAIYRDIQELDGLSGALVNVASAQAILGQINDAYQTLNEVTKLNERLNSTFSHLVVVFLSAELAILENRLEDAEKLTRNLLAEYRNELSFTIHLLILGQKAEILAKQGDLEGALQILLVFRANGDKAQGFLRMFAPFVMDQIEKLEANLTKNMPSEVRSRIEKTLNTQTVESLMEKYYGANVR